MMLAQPFSPAPSLVSLPPGATAGSPTSPSCRSAQQSALVNDIKKLRAQLAIRLASPRKKGASGSKKLEALLQAKQENLVLLLQLQAVRKEPLLPDVALDSHSERARSAPPASASPSAAAAAYHHTGRDGDGDDGDDSNSAAPTGGGRGLLQQASELRAASPAVERLRMEPGSEGEGGRKRANTADLINAADGELEDARTWRQAMQNTPATTTTTHPGGQAPQHPSPGHSAYNAVSATNNATHSAMNSSDVDRRRSVVGGGEGGTGLVSSSPASTLSSSGGSGTYSSSNAARLEVLGGSRGGPRGGPRRGSGGGSRGGARGGEERSKGGGVEMERAGGHQ